MARRKFTTFSMSFLDVMSCGLGAVVLMFFILNHESIEAFELDNEVLLAELRRLDFFSDESDVSLDELRRTITEIELKLEETKDTKTRLKEQSEEDEKELEGKKSGLVDEESRVEYLAQQVEKQKQQVADLEDKAEDGGGTSLRELEGEGNRQYLSGMKMDGKHVVVAIDASASMLDETLVNAIRKKNMSEAQRRTSEKWLRTVRTANWIAASLPIDSDFELITFNEKARAVLGDAQWRPSATGDHLRQAFNALDEIAPQGGTNLASLIDLLGTLSPAPDRVFLVTDGLPTLGRRTPRRNTISSRDRLKLFQDAVSLATPRMVFNIILLPLEGDIYAAGAYWELARSSGGSFLTPSADWP